MKYIGLSLLGILFVPLFLIFVLISSLKFQILNYDFVVGTFRKHNTYQSIPRLLNTVLLESENPNNQSEIEVYKDIQSKITPELAQEIIEANLKTTFSFLNGQSRELILYIPFKKLGLPNNFTKDTFTLSSFVANANINKDIDSLYGVGTKLTYLWLGGVALIVLIMVLELKLSKNFVLTQLFICALLLLGVSLLIKHTFIGMSKDLNTSIEPSQQFLGLVTSSLAVEIVNTWLIVALVLISAIVCLTVYLSVNKVKK